MKKITLLKSMLLAVILLVGSGSLLAQKQYQLVTDASELEANTNYIIVGINATNYYAVCNQASNNRPGTAVTTPVENVITTIVATSSTDTQNPYEITLQGSAGSWNLYDALNSVYLRPRTGNSNGLQGNAVAANWTISVASSGIASIVCTGAGSTTFARATMQFNYNNGTPLFACYATASQSSVYLYKEITSSVAIPTFSLEEGTYYSAQNVELVTETEGASIYYTTDGTEPTNESTLYTDAIQVNTTTTIKAIAYKDGEYSQVAEAIYTIDLSPAVTISTISETMVSTAGTAATQTFTISGYNLTDNIEITILDDNEYFSVSHEELVPVEGTVAETEITITYAPQTAGTHEALLEITEITDIIEITGTATLSTPVALDPTVISNNGFTASWEAVAGAEQYELNVYTQATIEATDLFFSEYAEGSGNNKYIEIYNGTNSAIDLSNYTLKQAPNGGGWDVDVTYTLNLSGTLDAGDVYIICNEQSSATIKNKADISISYSTTQAAGRIVSFNGDDALGLFKENTLIDIIGVQGEQPNSGGWNVAGVDAATKDHTLVRKPSVYQGNIDWDNAVGTNATDSEWIVYSNDTWTYVGAHDEDEHIFKAQIPNSPFTVTGTSEVITGLSPATTYYYTVKAKAGAYESAESNEISVKTTGTGTGLKDASVFNLYSANGQIHFNATAGENIEIYDSMGKLVYQGFATEGLNSIAVDAGIVMVRVGNEVNKVIVK